MKKHRLLFLSLLLPVAFLTTLIAPVAAMAAPMHTSQARAAMAASLYAPGAHLVLTDIKTTARITSASYTCGTNCNDLNPQGMCSQGAQTIISASILNTYTFVIWGLVELRWSPTCGTNWSRVSSYVGSQVTLDAQIRHPGYPPYDIDGDYENYTSGFQTNTTQTWSNMVYSPDDPVEAIGIITKGGQASGCAPNPPLPITCV